MARRINHDHNERRQFGRAAVKDLHCHAGVDVRSGRDQQAPDWAAMAVRTKPRWMLALRVAIAANAMQDRAAETNARYGYEQVDPT
jgi:hypothetical protein